MKDWDTYEAANRTWLFHPLPSKVFVRVGTRHLRQMHALDIPEPTIKEEQGESILYSETAIDGDHVQDCWRVKSIIKTNPGERAVFRWGVP